ncbi:MAG: DEAD/DEAH box helicase [Elainellaceae cyanobacterium]
MLPAHLADNVRRQVLYYLQSTFDFRDEEVGRAFERFLEDPEKGIFKGPWVQLKRPFRLADETYIPPFDIVVPFRPFQHQSNAWRRLHSKNQSPAPTLITTGTGSGKTECFLYPVLDHCFRAKQAGQPGIKAIVLYPMNALAADQEKRFAKTIWDDPKLKNAGIRVGTYTGRYDPSDPASRDSGETQMGKDHGITNHETQLSAPPDILLTNYKMLDFLLLRPQDQRLWRFNEPGTLQYLILDELHTYDGAQGADVACLIRRLKVRLGISKGQLCVVGTSATMDDRDRSDRALGKEIADAMETGGDRLAQFASTLFEEAIPSEAVIPEDRVTIEEILRPEDQLIDVTPPAIEDCQPQADEDAIAYARRQASLWQGPVYASEVDNEQGLESWGVELGGWLRNTRLFKHLLKIFDENERQGTDALNWRTLIDRVATQELEFLLITKFEDRRWILVSFFALVAHAKEIRSGRAFPLVPTQVQLWIRELTRIGRYVAPHPAFCWLDEPEGDRSMLPAFQCSECGASGWIGMQDPQHDSAIGARGVQGFKLTNDVKAIYQGFFERKGRAGRDAKIVIFMSEEDGAASQWRIQQEGGDQKSLFGEWYLHPDSLVIRRGEGSCPLTGNGDRFRVAINQDVEQEQAHGKTKLVGKQGCPCCGSQESVFIIGSRSATLSSVVVDELFGSVLNSDPKLLAFTDSVQDASHRAGFLSARTYNFSFRTALQRVVDDAGSDGIPLSQVGDRLLDWWSTPGIGRPGSLKEAIAALLPPDLADYRDYLTYRNNQRQTHPPALLLAAIKERLTWQATSEFGIMLLRGRTLESSGATCVAWDWDCITQTITALRDSLESVDVSLQSLSLATLCRWLLGILHRYRLRGALGHSYMESYARKSFWGKSPFGKFIPERETHPPFNRFRPRLMVTRGDRHHDNILGSTSGSTQPWHIRWTLRVLDRSNLGEVEALDLLKLLYEKAEASGLLQRLHTDSGKIYYAINPVKVQLVPNGVQLTCSETRRRIVRPASEAQLWDGSPSLEYSAQRGTYCPDEFTPRQRYYQDRYRKGALRRVVANEHTGLLATEERENLESSFSLTQHADDPNVLTCTSTLEMGIDIGDLSSTMLCSIPPTTASYLQRIGRAGRSTGTALIISVINHQPHDLFFYGRPAEMLRGKVDPPGCWVDAAAVLLRQYLAYCFDSATKAGNLLEMPPTGSRFVQDMDSPEGHLPRMIAWVTLNEAELQQAFLARFANDIRTDTRSLFQEEANTERLLEKIRKVAQEFARQRRELDNARRRLQDQKSKLDEHELEALQEIEDELRVLKGRQNSLSRITTLELLTNNGLLPNYAFPESGVRFYGSVYNRHRTVEEPIPPIEVVRPAASALRELAPHNHFYTHKRQFEIQQIGIGSREEPLTETWAICGKCGHMRPTSDLTREDASPACPQCHYDGGADSQADIGQHRTFVQFSRSQAISVMEQYESLSGDRSDERANLFYQRRYSFDLTVDAPAGATGEAGLPFGIEYRAAVVLREVNVGYYDDKGTVAFGPEGPAPENGFVVCGDCGVVAIANQPIDKVKHRRSCSARRKLEKARAEGRSISPFREVPVYLYREIKSEAIRILLPPMAEDEVQTLRACLSLGLRLRFEGDPSHLTIFPQQLPDGDSNLSRDYLVILDRVPGGTGYLKTLFQESDTAGRTGEGIMAVMRLALDAMESCRCGRLSASEENSTDGCYRCVRTYAQRYNAAQISRALGIRLLKQLIQAGERRTEQTQLTDIPNLSLFGSLLERELVRKLEEWVQECTGTWEKTLVQGKVGFRFTLVNPSRTWELELQPQLGPAQGVQRQCQPDFLLRCIDDESIRPVAIFADGFEFHVATNRLADDMAKRRAILNSGRYHVWNITWEDVQQPCLHDFCMVPPLVASKVEYLASAAFNRGMSMPMGRQAIAHPWQQFLEFIRRPDAGGWQQLAEFAAAFPLEVLAAHRTHNESALFAALEDWCTGKDFAPPVSEADGTWVCNPQASSGSDVVAFSNLAACLANRREQVRVSARLGDSEDERLASQTYRPRWRRFLACLNLFQFCRAFTFFTTSEVSAGTAPDVVPASVLSTASGAWAEVRDEVIPSFQGFVDLLAVADVPIPEAAYEDEAIAEEAIAELAWPDHSPPIAILAGDQASLASGWQAAGWKVATADELQAKGTQFLIDLLSAN